MSEISIIITTIKGEIETVKSLWTCPEPFQLVISKEHGLGFARNWGAKIATNDLLLFLDDDLTLHPQIWSHILNIKQGEFGMTFLSGFPCTRVMAIHKKDFWKVGGFNTKIRYTGEDRDFYVRALETGLKYKEIPIQLTQHKNHVHRHRNIHMAIGATKEDMQFILKYWRKYPQIFQIDFLARLKRFQIRTLLLEAFFFFYLLLSKRGGENHD